MKKNNQKGFTLILSLVLLLVMSLMGGSLIVISSGDHQSNNTSDEYQQTFYVAEHALVEAEKHIINEMIGDEVETIVGISINGIAFAQAIGEQLDLELAVSRSISEDGEGHISEVYASVEGKKVVIIDDVLSSGTTMKKTIVNLEAAGADVKLCLVLANKTNADEIRGIPLRSLIRVVTV